MNKLEYYETIMALIEDHDLFNIVYFWNSEDRNGFTAAVDCGDVFYWGSSDVEYIKEDDIPLFEECLNQSEYHGYTLYCARKRQMRPQGAFYKYIDDEKTKELLNAVGPEREIGIANPYTQDNEYKYRREE